MNLDAIAYKRNGVEAAERLRALWSRTAQDRVFAHVELPTDALRKFAETHDDGPTTYPDPKERIAFWDAHFAELSDLEDDSLPSAYLTEFDEGIYAGVLGAPMSYLLDSKTGWISSMSAPILNDLNEIDRLSVDNEAEVLSLLDEHLHIFTEASRGKFGVAPFIVIDAMNFVVEVRGATQAFIDVVDAPEDVRRLMEFALELNVFLQERVQGMIDTFCGGMFSALGQWAPGNPVQFSVDAYHMASPDFYYEWGEPYLQRLLNHFGGGLLHVHSNGRHLIEHVAKLDHLVCIHLADEPWNPRAYDELDRRQQEAGAVPLVVPCGFSEFERDLNAHRLPGNVLYKVSGVQSIADANRLMEKVRTYRVDMEQYSD